MNEHDSERISGLLEADGMSEAAAMDDADVIVLNTCCIRENADNKLYAQLMSCPEGPGSDSGKGWAC